MPLYEGTYLSRDWFKYLAIPAIMAIKPANRYNMDKTGILEGKGSNGLVLGRAKTKSVSIIKCVSAKGIPLYPLVIYKVTENGWTTDETAVMWLKRVFLPQTAPSQSEFIWQCYINNVYLLFLPLYTLYVLYPLNQSVFSPVKSAYRKELRYLSQWNDLTIIGKRNFTSCYQKARLTGLTAQNIKSGWKYTGLWPVAIAKPLTSSLLLPKASNPPSTPLNQTAQDAQGIQGIQDAQDRHLLHLQSYGQRPEKPESWIVNCTYSASWIKVSPRNASYSERSKKASKSSPFN
ncbi:transposase [Colletotrichum incanum]|uniref:Transposase n=1 Tax=Colletotrichum incanum TaxID=1573173 RepID=A0A166LAI3_COLIC|nr:transposase [Colletotrichum incanum]